jgi:xylono-1,5-lactonase
MPGSPEMASTIRVDCIVAAGCALGEGPVWDAAIQRLYWVDIKRPAVHAWDAQGGGTLRWQMPGPIGAIGLRGDGSLVGAFKSGFGLIDLVHGTVEMFAEPEPESPGNRFNDGKVDALGRFWAGSMDDAERTPTGHLYRLDADRRVTRFDAGFVCTNGIDWSSDGRTMYFTDTFERAIYAYDFDLATGEPGARRLFARVPEGQGYPDGLTVDAEDHVWGAHWDGSRITRYRPDGTVERVVPMPVPRCTSCCFGGPDLTTLFVTSAAIGLDAAVLERAPLSGGLFAVTGLGVQGSLSGVFRG